MIDRTALKPRVPLCMNLYLYAIAPTHDIKASDGTKYLLTKFYSHEDDVVMWTRKNHETPFRQALMTSVGS